jgi:hypothetical protein
MSQNDITKETAAVKKESQERLRNRINSVRVPVDNLPAEQTAKAMNNA